MKKFEQLKKSELEAMRYPSQEKLMHTWAKWGTKHFLTLKGRINYIIDCVVKKKLRKKIIIECLDMRSIRSRVYTGASTSRRWWVEAGTDSKAYSTLREAYNAARKCILAGITGDPKNFINQ